MEHTITTSNLVDVFGLNIVREFWIDSSTIMFLEMS